jgi:hypothetical protein
VGPRAGMTVVVKRKTLAPAAKIPYYRYLVSQTHSDKEKISASCHIDFTSEINKFGLFYTEKV